jgi:hypothetical protein
MDVSRVAHVVRAVPAAVSRRHLARGIAGLPLGGILGSLLSDGAMAKKRGRSPCPPCQRKRKKAPVFHPKCQIDSTLNQQSCLGDGKCWEGVCVPRPKCLGHGSFCVGTSIGCCSLICTRVCEAGAFGSNCLESVDCATGLSCVSYQCR